MPKVISRAAISSSDQAPETASSKAVLRTFYCLCGEFLLVIDKGLDRLPRRRTDESYIIRTIDGPNLPLQAARKFKLNAVPGKRCLIKRKADAGLEVRTPLNCSRCNTTVAYQTTPAPIASGTFVYLLKGSVTEVQGRPPPDAFHSEHLYALSSTEQSIHTQLSEEQAALVRRANVDKGMIERVERDRRELREGGVGGMGVGGSVMEIVERDRDD